LHEIQTIENCQIEKHGRHEIITVAIILLTNLMVLIDCVHPAKTITFEFSPTNVFRVK